MSNERGLFPDLSDKMTSVYPGLLELSPPLLSCFVAALVSLPHTWHIEASPYSLSLSLWLFKLGTINTWAAAIHCEPTICQALYQLAVVPDCKQQKQILTQSKGSSLEDDLRLA